jgi:hypothetical protein
MMILSGPRAGTRCAPEIAIFFWDPRRLRPVYLAASGQPAQDFLLFCPAPGPECKPLLGPARSGRCSFYRGSLSPGLAPASRSFNSPPPPAPPPLAPPATMEFFSLSGGAAEPYIECRLTPGFWHSLGNGNPREGAG